MVKKLILLGCLFVTLVVGGGAVDYVYPSSPFVLAEAEAQIAPGPSQLSGQMSRSELSNVRVALYPMTAHFQEFLELQDSASDKPYRSPALDQRARRCRLVVEAKDGQFSFRGIRPGKYYLEYPAMYNSGDSPEIDEIFAQGGCVYFIRSQGLSIEIPQTDMIELEL